MEGETWRKDEKALPDLSGLPPARIAVVQFGDFREAYLRLRSGGPETYYAQRYSIRVFEEIASAVGEFLVVFCNGAYPIQRLDDGIQAAGVELFGKGGPKALLRVLEEFAPDHLVLRTPLREPLAWGRRRKIRVLPLLADSFRGLRIRGRIQAYLFARLCNKREVEWVSNHNLGSCRDLARLGIPREKIVPWDWPWPERFRPSARLPKTAPSGEGGFQLLYVGAFTPSKGPGDCVRALGRLVREGMEVSLTLLGLGPPPAFLVRLVLEEGLTDRVRFLDSLPNEEVIPLMRRHDLVLVPSRHDYPEGLPKTINEGLASRTPLLVSDHPMFVENLPAGMGALSFRAGDPEDLARQARRILLDRELYAELSESTERAWEKIQCPVKFGELLVRWIRNGEEDRQWLARNSLAGRT